MWFAPAMGAAMTLPALSLSTAPLQILPISQSAVPLQMQPLSTCITGQAAFIFTVLRIVTKINKVKVWAREVGRCYVILLYEVRLSPE